MTDDEIQRFGADIATAIRAEGQRLADMAGSDPKMTEVIVGFFDRAAQVAELRTQIKRSARYLSGGARR